MVTLLHGDCLDEMNAIPEESIDLILTDPPYGTIKNLNTGSWKKLNTSWDEEIDHTQMMAQCNRVLRKNGALVLFSQDPYTQKLIIQTHNNLPFSYRYTWEKDHFANALICKKAPVNYTEDICVFFKKYETTKNHPLRDYACRIQGFIGKTIREINKELGHRRADHFLRWHTTQFGLCTESTYEELIDFYGLDAFTDLMSYVQLKEIDQDYKVSRIFNLEQGKKFRPNLLKFKKDYTGYHPTQKPVALLETLIQTYTNEGDRVLDFTIGSGSTGIACKNLNREFIGIEKNKQYYDVAKARIDKHEVNA